MRVDLRTVWITDDGCVHYDRDSAIRSEINLKVTELANRSEHIKDSALIDAELIDVFASFIAAEANKIANIIAETNSQE